MRTLTRLCGLLFPQSCRSRGLALCAKRKRWSELTASGPEGSAAARSLATPSVRARWPEGGAGTGTKPRNTQRAGPLGRRAACGALGAGHARGRFCGEVRRCLEHDALALRRRPGGDLGGLGRWPSCQPALFSRPPRSPNYQVFQVFLRF